MKLTDTQIVLGIWTLASILVFSLIISIVLFSESDTNFMDQYIGEDVNKLYRDFNFAPDVRSRDDFQTRVHLGHLSITIDSQTNKVVSIFDYITLILYSERDMTLAVGR